MNVTVHAAETCVATLVDEHLPKLMRAAGEVSADWALWQSRPHTVVPGVPGDPGPGDPGDPGDPRMGTPPSSAVI